MKLSCSSWSYHRALEAGRLDLDRWLSHCAHELELNGVEIEDKHLPRKPAQLHKVRCRIEEEGLVLANVTTFNDFGHEEEAQNRAELDRVRRWTDNALELGCSTLRVFAGWPHAEREAAWDRMLDYLERACEYAETQGLMLLVENHNHDGFLRTGDDVARVLRAVDSPALGFLLDTGNFLDGLRSIEQTAPWARHVHAKLLELDARGAERRIDHARVLALLHEVGYRGFISVEYEGEEPEEQAVPRAVTFLRGLLTAEGQG